MKKFLQCNIKIKEENSSITSWITVNGNHVPIINGKPSFESLSKQKADNFSASEYTKGMKEEKCTPNEAGLLYMINQMHDTNLKDKVMEIEKKNEELVSTFDRHWINGDGVDAVFDKERTALHEKIIEKYLEEGENAICKTNETPTLILLGGRGGSGKSKFDGIVYDSKKYLVIDSDKIKEMLPEYNGWNASQVHEESSCIMKKIVQKARNNRMNIVIDGTMSNAEKYLQYLEDFKGYKTEAHYMFVPPQESVQRAFRRFSNGGKYNGRYVPAKVLMDMDKNEENFDIIKKKVDKWSFYNNYCVGEKEKPILIAKKN